MNHRPLATAAAAVVALLVPIGTACSSDDDATLPTETSEETDPLTTTTSEADDDVETTETTESTGSDPGTAGGDEPQDEALDVNMRNPQGVTLTLSQLSFDSGDILVEAEVVNGSTLDIRFHRGSGGDDALRLVDDAGQTYPFIEPTEGDDRYGLDLAPGERISGTLAFRGPLSDKPSRLTLITNLTPEEVQGFDLDNDDRGGRHYPAFVVPMDLTWA